MHFLGGTLHVGMTAREQQATRGANARTDQAQVGRGVE
jgi:hypothetical protein